MPALSILTRRLEATWQVDVCVDSMEAAGAPTIREANESEAQVIFDLVNEV